MRTEIPFTLPRGYVDPAGQVHRDGTMRLATARDEIEPLREVEVRTNVTDVTPQLIEGLFAADFDHLQRLYERVNTDEEAVGVVSCPHCSQPFEVDLTEIEDGRLGE
jgi:hypothetical protein